MDEDDGGSFRGLTRFLEELTMNGHAVARLEDDFPRNDQAAGGKGGGDAIETNPLGWSSAHRHYGWYWRALCGRADERNRSAVASDERSPLETGAGRHYLRRGAIHWDTHDVASIHIVAVASC